MYHLIRIISTWLYLSTVSLAPISPPDEMTKDQVQVLLLGSSHWASYEGGGSDVAQTYEIDILSEQYQREVQEIAQRIVAFGPDKIFVERTLEVQGKVDSLYQLYTREEWGEGIRNEIVQLGFRVANMMGHERVYGIDYRTSFPYRKMKEAMKEAGQEDLILECDESTEVFENAYNKMVREKSTLKEFFYFLNDPEQRRDDLDWYLRLANQAGPKNNTTGSFLAAEWLKRNIYSYGLMQKYTEPGDKKIMVLMGSSHTAVFDFLMQTNPNWVSVELKDLMEN